MSVCVCMCVSVCECVCVVCVCVCVVYVSQCFEEFEFLTFETFYFSLFGKILNKFLIKI